MKIFASFVKRFFLSVILTVLLSITINAQVFNGPGFTVVDGGARTAASCSTVPVTITGTSHVASVSINSVTHSWLGDIEVRVYPPGSTPPPSTAAPSVVLTSPPDGRPCNLAGTYTFTDMAAQSIDAATVGCADATNLAPGNYRSSTYGGGTNPGPLTSVTAQFGNRTPANSNGNWLVCVFDFATPDGGTVGSTSINFVPVLAAPVSISGRVATTDGRGIPSAQVTITDTSGNSRTVITNGFGYYRFDELAAGETYTISAARKGFEFQPIVQQFSADRDDVDITPIE